MGIRMTSRRRRTRRKRRRGKRIKMTKININGQTEDEVE